MRILSFNPNIERREPQPASRQAPRAHYLRVIESAAPASNAGRLLQFHRHREPAPAA